VDKMTDSSADTPAGSPIDSPAGVPHRQRISGTSHWRWQRYSAVALFCAMAYFVYLVTQVGSLDYAGALAFVAAPAHAIGLVFLVVIGLFHATLGLEVVIEDYVSLKNGRRGLIYSVKGVMIIICAACLWSLGAVAL
jgi:succinate dehydrogenase / fumarate reductase, membrane anchor subunit